MPTNPLHLRPTSLSVRRFLRHYARRKQARGEQVFCLQIGANDGKINDPVHEYFRDHEWRGLLVEPLVDVFRDELSRNYAGNQRVILENVALAPTDGHLPFYRVAVSRSRWATGLSGFRRDSIQSHIDNGYIQRRARAEGVVLPADPARIIETIQVPTMSVEQLLARHGITAFDVLCIDTEGYDFEILKMVDFQRYRPEVLVFESKNLTDADYVAAKELLQRQGYALYWDRGDTLGTRIEVPRIERAAAALNVRWQQLKRWLRKGARPTARDSAPTG